MDSLHEENESQLIGCVLTDPDLLDKAAGLGITADHFSSLHADQWRFLCELRVAGKALTPEVILAESAKDQARFARFGGAIALLSHPQSTTLHFGSLVSAVLDIHAKRRSYLLLHRATEALKAGTATLDEVRELSEQAAAVCAGEQRISRSLAEIDAEVETNLKEIEEGKSLTGAISWGLPKLDKYMKPIRKNEYVLVCGRPSRGKTSMLTHLAGYNLSHGKRVVYFNLEDADTEIVVKMAAQMAGICYGEWANLTNDQRATFRTYKAKIVKSTKFMVFDRDTTLEAIQARCRLLAQTFKPELVIIDYLGCMRLPGKSIYESVSTVSKAMPPLRKLLGCPLVVGQQLKRLEDESREPGLQDLRDSGQLEEDAARAVMLHWKDSSRLDVDYRDYVILQPKYRFGPTTAVGGITFHAPTTRFVETATN